MILCDWCGQAKECLQKEIDGSVFDICADCWRPIEEKLKGRGGRREARNWATVTPWATLDEYSFSSTPHIPAGKLKELAEALPSSVCLI